MLEFVSEIARQEQGAPLRADHSHEAQRSTLIQLYRKLTVAATSNLKLECFVLLTGRNGKNVCKFHNPEHKKESENFRRKGRNVPRMYARSMVAVKGITESVQSHSETSEKCLGSKMTQSRNPHMNYHQA